MKRNRIGVLMVTMLTSVLLVLSAGCNDAMGPKQVAVVEGIPLFLEKISDRTIMVSVGEHTPTVKTLAVNTAKGIVVFDTGISPSLATEARKAIEVEFGSRDFASVINTHHHFDHTSGNQAYSDVEIIGHENNPDGMRQFEAGLKSFVQARKAANESRKEQLKALDPESEEASVLQERIALENILCGDMEAGYQCTPPTKVFTDSYSLDCGDVHINLSHYGKGHTDNDIVAYIPEEGIFVTGDTFSTGFIQFAISTDVEIEKWIEILDNVLEDEQGLKLAFSAHEGVIDRPVMVAWKEYLEILNEGIERADKDGISLNEAKERLKLDESYSLAKHLDLESTEQFSATRLHDNNLMILWMRIKDPALIEIKNALERGGAAEARTRFEDIKGNPGNRYFFDEYGFNALGYKLLGEEKIEEAVEIFRIMVEFASDSANARDSLGEAYMKAGRKEESLESYRKSLALNPGNENARKMIAELE